MLSNEETAELLEKAQNGDDYAKEQLITINSPLIKSIIRRYLNKGVDYDDLYQLGAMGFVKAINNYDANYNVKFTTYAVPMIAGEIKRFLRDDGSIKVSRTIKHNAMLIRNYIDDYVKKYNKTPNVETIGKALNIEVDDVVLSLEAGSKIMSLNDKCGSSDDDNLTLMEKVSDSFSAENLTDKLALKEMINTLSKREKQVVVLRYFMDKTQSETAHSLGISQVQVSRIENKILANMREQMTVE